MICFIARHGHALNVGEQGVTKDADRPLSITGKKQITSVAKGLNQIGIKIDFILCSPFKRTCETAQLYADILNKDLKVIASTHLESGARFENYKTAMEEYKLWQNYAKKNVMLIGHAPDVGKVVDALASLKGMQLDTGNIAQIQIENPDGPGIMTGFWSPSIFQQQ
jgi:phosphohistidine phosphatase